jgi:PAS domain S-box-containing protein
MPLLMNSEKKQAKFFTIGLGIPLFTYLVTNMALPGVGLDTPNLGHFAIMFFSVLVAYSILRYELFTFDAALAAENIVSIMPDSLILADMHGKILRVNKRLLNFLSYGEDELIGKSIPDLCLQKTQCANVLKQLTEQRAINDFELKFSTKLGEEKNVLFSGSVVKSKTGQDVGFTCIIHDITERNQMQAKLQKYSNHLEDLVKDRTAQLEKAQRFAAIGELAGMVGHDLRNPITGIKNAAYFLKKKGASIPEAKVNEMLETIDKCVENSNRIICDLLDYSREIHLELAESSPRKMIANSLAIIQVPDKVKVVNNLSDELRLNVDINKLQRVFTNLVKNGIDAMPNGGTLTLNCKKIDDCVEFSIADTGIGIDEDILPKIFTPLFTTKAQGMGFGLSICKRMVEAHGGIIAVETLKGKGSTFTVKLPIEPNLKLVTKERG